MSFVHILCQVLATTLWFHQAFVTATQPINTGGPSEVTEGRDALLTCVIMGPYSNDTVLWRKGSKSSNQILAAGTNRVTNDKRISILHDDSPRGKEPSGGDVWVLLIKDTRLSDSDLYTCEVNSDPVVRSFHPLIVRQLAHASTPSKEDGTHKNSDKNSKTNPKSTTNNPMEMKTSTEATSAMPELPTESTVTHDFTDCCQSLNVSTKCIGYCAVHNILDGTTGIDPEACEKDFPSIVKCMADGRNHVPCCEKNLIPDLCQDMCRGEYTPFTDLLRSRVSCVSHTIPALKCILEGIKQLPVAPESVFMEAISERTFNISWVPGDSTIPVNSYTVNLTMLQAFDEDFSPNRTDLSVDVTNGDEWVIVTNMTPFAMYSVEVTANNKFGSSLPSYRVRALTMQTEVNAQTNVAVVPVLPDVRGCCARQGMTHRTCIDKMCDPKKTDFAEVPDLMVCAPWANITFSCLANKIDHTPCCKERGIPEACLPFCAGNVQTITFNLFKCLHYMSDYSSCLLQGYGVLPGPPSRFKPPLVSAHFAILQWDPPKILPDTVTAYHLFYRKLGSGADYKIIENTHAPAIIEDLDAGEYYQAYVAALNAHGKGEPSNRLLFHTKHEIETEPPAPGYNLTTCCHASGLLPQCMPLCSYDIRMSDLQSLGQTCTPQMGALAKCAAGGRDHTDCCNRRGVPPRCISLCRGVLPQPPTECLQFAGNIIQCFEEGTGNIPGPIEDLHVTAVTNTTIALAWVPSDEDTNRTDTIDFLIQYGKVNNMTMYETIVKLDQELNTTDTEFVLQNLEPSALYRILVVARGVHGSSLPSSMLLINTSNKIDFTSSAYGAPSPPHSLAITTHSATWVTIAWQPPEFSHPHETILYKIYHKPTAADKFAIIETRLLWARLSNLNPNSQHVVYVVANGTRGASLPSETLVAWTDPALPAFVDPPTIHPSDIIAEGGSMTVLCLALGNPAPKISLYIGGHLLREDTSRHMVTVIHNVTADMEHVSCYADNGYGIPMQASKKINISYAPRIQASGITVAFVDETVELKCTVKAKPPPKTIFWRDHDGRVPVILGGKYDMTLKQDPEDTTSYSMVLTITKVSPSDVGDYYCHAENALGSITRPVSVRIRNTAAAHNISECCVTHNVSANCMSACSFYLDIDAVSDRPECLIDFDKLMKCAADGSDHRMCCAGKDVPRKCLNWCRGEPTGATDSCALQYTKTIIGCFQSNRDRLPGPPQGLSVQVVSDDEVLVKWEAPVKNPQTVEGYRIFWHEAETSMDDLVNKINGISTSRLDSKDTSVRIDGLRQGVVYELVVKAGNVNGASVITDPIRFTLGDHHITSTSHSHTAGTISGIIAGMLAIALAVAALFLYKRRTFGRKAANGVAFENPSYLREVNMEHVHIPAVSAETATDWRQEPLQTPSSGIEHNSVSPVSTEVNPSLYEELKLGHDGAGFKRLVS